MSVFGTGIMPSGNIANELQAVTRRAFIPKLIVNMYKSSPLLAGLLSNNQYASGGVSQTQPVQGSAMVSGSWSDYSGSFNQPPIQNGVQNAEFNLKLQIVPIPFLGMEAAVQMDHDVISLIEARMNDATNVTRDMFATALFNNTTNAQAFIGLPGAVDDGTNLNVYSNINRTTNTFWKSKVYAAGSVNPTRQNVLQYIAGTVKNSGGEMPSYGVCGIGTWALLAQDFVGQETYQITPGAGFDEGSGPRSAFTALMVAGVPIYADPYCPEGTMYLINSDYMTMYLHESATFAFSGFQSTLPNYQLGYVGALVTIGELFCAKPMANTRVGGFNFLTI